MIDHKVQKIVKQMTLGYRRMIYVEFTLSEKMEHFLGGHKNAFEFFGGNPTNGLYTGEALVFSIVDGIGLFVHPQRSDDANLIYTLETSTNLVSGTWTNAGYAVLGTNVTGSTLNYVTNAVPTDQGQTYIRLKVEN